MPSFNQVIIMGNLTADPELKYLQDGTPVCSINVAVNEEYTDKAGEKKKSTVFVSVTTWGKQGENVAEYLKKGSLCHILGKLKLDTWLDKNSGAKRSKITIVAQRVTFLGKPAGKSEPSDDEKKNQPETEQGNEFPLDENGEAMPNF